MKRPDIEEYRRRLNGADGLAARGFLLHAGVDQLLEYIEVLEARDA